MFRVNMSTPPVFENFTQAYRELVKMTYEGCSHETSPRGMRVRENLFVSFSISDPRDRLLFVPERKFPLDYCMAEILWYLSGNDRTDWIASYSSFWKDISDDGETANSAYGARIFRYHPYHSVNEEAYPHLDVECLDPSKTQWDLVKEELRRDPDSRRAVIHIRQPQDSQLAFKDQPCTLNLQFLIRDQKLHLIVQMRSNDIVRGLALDVPAFTFVQEMMALELGVGLGPYHHTSNSLHVYERHYEMCRAILASEPSESIPMPALGELPPVDRLMDLEARGRLATTADDLVRLGNEARLMEDPLWVDWAHVLLSHRAKKLGLDGTRTWFLDGLTTPAFKGCSR